MAPASPAPTIFTFNGSNNYFTGEPVSGAGFTAIFPSPDGGSYLLNGNKYIYTLQKNVSHRADSYSQPMPMIAKTKNADNYLSFRHAAGMIRVSMSGSLTVTKITLKGNNDEQIAGTAELDVTEDTPVLHMASNYSGGFVYKEQVLTVGSGGALTSTPTNFYFVVPAITFNKGITIEVEFAGKTVTVVKSTDNPVTIGRGMMKTFTTVDTDASLTAEASVDLAALNAIYAALGSPASLSGWGTDSDISNWDGITAENGIVTAIDLSNKGLNGTISEKIGDLRNLTSVNFSNNNLTGNVPASLIKLTKLTNFDVSNNIMDGFIYDEVCFTTWWDSLTKNIAQKGGKSLKLGYISSDFTADGTKATLQIHSEGNGIPIYITGDAFSDRLQSDFNSLATQSMEYFFSIEPYKTYRDYFDVYRLNKVSKNEGVRSGADLAYNTTVGTGAASYTIDTDKVIAVMKNVLGLNPTDNITDVLTIVLLHLQSEAKRAICHFDNLGFGAALIPVDENMEVIIHHEAGGHGFACLADEYDSDDPGTTSFPAAQHSVLDSHHVSSFEDSSSPYRYGWNKNVDYDTNTATIQWAEFLKAENSAYVTKEGVSANSWEGAHAKYKKGIYRSTENSTMRNQYELDRFNPQSRWLIYRRIMIQGKGLSTEPSFADFKSYDMAATVNKLPPVATTRNYVEKKTGLLGAPPVMIKR